VLDILLAARRNQVGVLGDTGAGRTATEVAGRTGLASLVAKAGHREQAMVDHIDLVLEATRIGWLCWPTSLVVPDDHLEGTVAEVDLQGRLAVGHSLDLAVQDTAMVPYWEHSVQRCSTEQQQHLLSPSTSV
jgi:hypothetical protein